MGNGTLRVYQERWYPFANLPNALKAFEEKTGIATELHWDAVGVGTIEHMFDQMIGSFRSEQPRFDLICTDEIILRHMARSGRVLDLGPLMRRDGIGLDHVTEATRHSVSLDGQVLGLPCVNVSSMLLCRRDLLERYGLSVPRDWGELRDVASALQEAVRRDERREFYGFESRGAGGGGHSVWTIGSFLGSFGARWIGTDGGVVRPGDAHHAGLTTYLDLMRACAPPDIAGISFVEMRRDYAAGRVGIIMDVGMEYAHVLSTNPDLAERSVVAMVPAGPAGRAPNLYAPPYAIAVGSDMKEEAWELAKFLCSDRQLLEDGLRSNAIETSSLPVLFGSDFDGSFRSDLLSTVRSSRAVAQQERPFCEAGIAACETVGNAINAMLAGDPGVDRTLDRIASGLRELVME